MYVPFLQITSSGPPSTTNTHSLSTISVYLLLNRISTMLKTHLSNEALIQLILWPIGFLLTLIIAIWQGRGRIVNHFNGVNLLATGKDDEESIELTARSSTSETADDNDGMVVGNTPEEETRG